MTYNDIDFNNKTILITGGAGFIGSNLAFYFQENYPDAHVVVFDCFRSEAIFANGNLQSFGHYKNLIGFDGVVISGDINDKDLLNQLEELYKEIFEVEMKLREVLTFIFATILNFQSYDLSILGKDCYNFLTRISLSEKEKSC